MNNEDKILEVLSVMSQDIKDIKDDIAELKEEHQMTREGVNRLLAWAEECGYVVKFPLPKL